MKLRLAILGLYLRVCLSQGPWEAYCTWKRTQRREKRFYALYGRELTMEEATPIINKQLWYHQVLHREPSDAELDQIIQQAMAWQEGARS